MEGGGVMREKKGERCRCGGEEKEEQERGWEGEHAWESCGRCLKTLKADDEKRLSRFPTRFPGLPFPVSHSACPHLPTHSSSLPLSPLPPPAVFQPE